MSNIDDLLTRAEAALDAGERELIEWGRMQAEIDAMFEARIGRRRWRFLRWWGTGPGQHLPYSFTVILARIVRIGS